MAVDNTNDTMQYSNIVSPVGKTWRPIRPVRWPVSDPIAIRIRKIVLPPPAATDPSGTGGIPEKLISINATESPSKQQDRTFSEVSINFTRDANDANFNRLNIWFKGYKGNTKLQLMATTTDSPYSFLVETTKETVTVYGQTVGLKGETADVSFALTTVVQLDGVVSAPPAPSIASQTVGTATGYQFAFNQVDVGSTQDVIQAYRVYQNTANNSATASLVQTIAHDPTHLGAVTVTITVNAASGAIYYFWVSAVNTVGLESVKTAAQSGNPVGSTGSIPAALSTPFKIATTTSSITLSSSPGTFFTRADGTTTNVGQTSNAITGLTANNTFYGFPYWRESDQTLQFVKASDVNIPNIIGETNVAASSQWIQTATTVALSSFTLEGWFKGSVAANQALFSHSNVQGTGAPASVEVQAFATSAGEIEFAIWNGAAWKTVTTAGASVLDGSWHHVMCVHSATAGTITVYVDSANTSDSVTFWTTSSTGAVSATTGYWHLGFAGGFAGAPLTTNTFNSFTLSHFSIYATALTSHEAGSHFVGYVCRDETTYNSEITYDTAIYYWKLSEPSGTNAGDSAGSNTGTYQGTPTLNQTSAVITVQGTPQVAWPYPALNAVAFQVLRIFTPLSGSTGISAKTVAGGTGSGGGTGGYGGGVGGRGGCFTGNTQVKTERGNVAIRDIRGCMEDEARTAAGYSLPVLAVIEHPAEPRLLHHMGNDEWVTYDHKVLFDGKWTKAGEVFPETKWFNESVYTLSMLSMEDIDDRLKPTTERSFQLANGFFVTNVMIEK